MKLKFKNFKIIFTIFFLAGCSLRSVEIQKDFLVSKFSLLGVFDYNPNDMTRKGHISSSSPAVRYDNLFDKKSSYFQFKNDSENNSFTFSFILKYSGGNEIRLDDYSYSLNMESSDYGTIEFITDSEIFEKKENTINPNYWLRVRAEIDFGIGNKDVILEFRTVYN